MIIDAGIGDVASRSALMGELAGQEAAEIIDLRAQSSEAVRTYFQNTRRKG